MTIVKMKTKIAQYRQHINPYWLDVIESLELPVSYQSAKGSTLIDSEGNEWLDLVAGYGSVSLGHNNDTINAKIGRHLQQNQPAIYPWGANLAAAELAARLVELSPLDDDARVVFSCSGSEAIETGLKMAMAFNQRQQFISFKRGFHGMTMAAMALNGSPIWAEALPQQPAFDSQFCCVADLAECESLLATKQYAAVVIEIVQGIGGGFRFSDEALASLAQSCHDSGTCLIVDEVQTGLGRTGTMFAAARFPPHLPPDMIVLGKGLTGGELPLSATLCRPQIHHALFGQPAGARIHGSTYSAYSTAIVAAMAVLDYIEAQQILDTVKRLSQHLRQRLAQLQQRFGSIRSVEGDGLLVTVTFDSLDLANFCLQNFFANQILINLCAQRDNTIKITPPLNIEQQSLDTFCDVLEAIVAAYEGN